MKNRLLLAPLPLLAALAACSGDSTGPGVVCQPFTNLVAETRGDTVVTTTGLRYLETRVGAGRTAEACTRALVHYTLYLADGTLIESSVDRGSPYIVIPAVDNVIPGFAQGVVGMRVGGQRRIIVPPALGYGSRGSEDGDVPPNTTIVFDLSLEEVVGT